MNKKIRRDSWTIVTVVVIALFVLFLLYPLIGLFSDGLKDTETGVWIIGNHARLFLRKHYKSALLNSFKLTFSVIVAAIILGAPLAHFMSFYKIKGKGVLEILSIISMMSPNFIGAYPWILFLGRSGTMTQLLKGLGIHTPSIYGFGGTLLVFTPKLYPFIYMYVSGAFKKIDMALSEATESLECGGLRKVFAVVIPLVAPILIAAALLVFMNCMADFGTPVLIGEGYRVMPTLVYSEFMGETGGSVNFTVYMATIIVVVTATMLLPWKWYVNTKSSTMSSMRPIRPKEIYGVKGLFMHPFIYLLVTTSIIPQCMVVYTSFRIAKMQVFVDGFSLESYHKVFSTAIQSIRNTYLYCLTAIVIIVVLGMFIVYLAVRRKNWLTNAIDTIAMFPYIVPDSALGIILLIAFNHPSMVLAGSAIAIAVSLVTRRQAYTPYSSSATLYQISPSMKEAATSLDDSLSVSFVKVTAKMMLPSVAPGAVLSQAVPINELSSSVMLYTANTRTMSVVIYNEVIRANYGTATTLATILTVTIVVSLLIFFKVSGNKDVTMRVPYDKLKTVIPYGVLELRW